MKKAVLLSIGHELLIGQVINSNAAWLGDQLASAGITVCKVITIGDIRTDILQALDDAFASADLVISTGGLGPTRDDMTKTAIADYFGVGMLFHEGTWIRIRDYFEKRGIPIAEAHKEQCYMPEGAEVLDNPLGTAPGLVFTHDTGRLVVLPGVPHEMRSLMQTCILPRLAAEGGTEAFYRKTFLTAGVGETQIADHIRDFEDALVPGMDLAYLPSIGQVRIRLSQHGGSSAGFDQKVAELRDLLDRWLYGEDEDSLEAVVGRLLTGQGKKLVLAESCTGGNIARLITSVPGSSPYFPGGVVTYSNEWKMALLNVSAETLDTHGAVSEQTVREMVQGALTELHADIAAAVSGIAGPDGGTPDKPVGTIWVAVGDRNRIVTRLLQFNRDRIRNVEFASVTTLNMIRKFLIAGDLT